MTVFVFALAALFSALPWLISRHYRPRLAGRARVVMNWSFDGRPNSYASPRVALSLTPAVATLSLFLLAGFVAFATPPGEQVLAVPVMALLAGVSSAVHAGHLHFAARQAER